MRILLQPAYILHHRPYRETSVLLELFTRDHGRLSAVARGVRQPRSRLRALLQPFLPLLVSWQQGQSELVTLTAAESPMATKWLQGECLLSGFYLNELLIRTVAKHDPHPELYTIYQNTLLELQERSALKKSLRLFEKKLLEQIGYGLTAEAFEDHAYYQFHPETGFKRYQGDQDPAAIPTLFSGKNLAAFFAEKDWDEKDLQMAKRLMRLVLAPLLGPPLKSRQLFIRG